MSLDTGPRWTVRAGTGAGTPSPSLLIPVTNVPSDVRRDSRQVGTARPEGVGRARTRTCPSLQLRGPAFQLSSAGRQMRPHSVCARRNARSHEGERAVPTGRSRSVGSRPSRLSVRAARSDRWHGPTPASDATGRRPCRRPLRRRQQIGGPPRAGARGRRPWPTPAPAAQEATDRGSATPGPTPSRPPSSHKPRSLPVMQRSGPMGQRIRPGGAAGGPHTWFAGPTPAVGCRLRNASRDDVWDRGRR